MNYELLINGIPRRVTFVPPAEEATKVTALIDGRSVEADVARFMHESYSVLLEGHSIEVTVEKTAQGLLARVYGYEFHVTVSDPRSWQSRQGPNVGLEGRQEVLAPMPGKIVNILVEEGQKVSAGQGLLVIEAMKMQNEMRSPKSGTIERVIPVEGLTVNAGEVLVIIA